MPKRAGNGTGLALPRSPVCSILLILQNLMYWSAFQLAKSPSVGGDRWGHHTLIERRLIERPVLLSRPWRQRAATVVPDTLPDGRGHAGPRDCAQGAARSPDMSAHPPQVQHSL